MERISTISNSLSEKRLIKYPWAMILYSKLMGTQSNFKVGTYGLNTEMTLIQVHDYLVKGKQQLYKITIPEGWTSNQIAEYLDRKEITKAEDFLFFCIQTPTFSKKNFLQKKF